MVPGSPCCSPLGYWWCNWLSGPPGVPGADSHGRHLKVRALPKPLNTRDPTIPCLEMRTTSRENVLLQMPLWLKHTATFGPRTRDRLFMRRHSGRLIPKWLWTNLWAIKPPTKTGLHAKAPLRAREMNLFFFFFLDGVTVQALSWGVIVGPPLYMDFFFCFCDDSKQKSPPSKLPPCDQRTMQGKHL